jgi:hypothetical protein
MRVTDKKLLREVHELEADRKFLMGYRFKGLLASARRNGEKNGAAKVRAARRKQTAAA